MWTLLLMPKQTRNHAQTIVESTLTPTAQTGLAFAGKASRGRIGWHRREKWVVRTGAMKHRWQEQGCIQISHLGLWWVPYFRRAFRARGGLAVLFVSLVVLVCTSRKHQQHLVWSKHGVNCLKVLCCCGCRHSSTRNQLLSACSADLARLPRSAE